MFRPQYLSLASLWFLLLTFAAGVAYALAYSSLVIFGDSLADSVNNATVNRYADRASGHAARNCAYTDADRDAHLHFGLALRLRSLFQRRGVG